MSLETNTDAANPAASAEDGGAVSSPAPGGERVELVRTLADGRPKRELPGYVRKRLDDGKPRSKQWGLTRFDQMVQRLDKDFFFAFNNDLSLWELWKIHPHKREEYCLVFRLQDALGDYVVPDERIVRRIKMFHRESGIPQAELERMEEQAREIEERQRREMARNVLRQLMDEAMCDATNTSKVGKILRPVRSVVVPGGIG